MRAEKRYTITLGKNNEFKEIIDHSKQDKHISVFEFLKQVEVQEKAFKKLKKENKEFKRTYNICKFRRMNDANVIYCLEKENKELKKENEQLRKENQKLESLWEDKCIREYMGIVGEYALQEMHNKKYGDK